jgi:hypothetical protein
MNRKLVWTDEAWKGYIYWQSQDKKTLKRINKLINDTMKQPFAGIGKPEPRERIYLVFGLGELMKLIDLYMLLMMILLQSFHVDITTESC